MLFARRSRGSPGLRNASRNKGNQKDWPNNRVMGIRRSLRSRLNPHPERSAMRI